MATDNFATLQLVSGCGIWQLLNINYCWLKWECYCECKKTYKTKRRAVTPTCVLLKHILTIKAKLSTSGLIPTASGAITVQYQITRSKQYLVLRFSHVSYGNEDGSTYISCTMHMVDLHKCYNRWYDPLVKYQSFKMIMIMEMYIAQLESGTFYLLRFTYVPLRPLCILCFKMHPGTKY